ncbi:MAG: DUF1600 domain-containing protein, partial [Malacoplasma sp.]|nr:DUF1600 domain-containing protein [Malacoplasma sp.]
MNKKFSPKNFKTRKIDKLSQLKSDKDFFIGIYNKRDKTDYLRSSYLRNNFVVSILLIICLVTFFTGFFSYYQQDVVINDLNNPLQQLIDDNNKYNWANLSGIDTNLRVLRAVFDLSLAWTIFLYCYVLKIAITLQIKKVSKLFSWLLIFSIIPIIAFLFLSLNAFKNYDSLIVKYEIKAFFSKKTYLERQFKLFSLKRNLIFIEWILYLPLIACIFLYRPSVSFDNWSHNFWFERISYFTIQANLLVFLFLTLILLFPWWQIFKNNNFQIVATTYISVVTLIWCLVLLPNFITTSTFSRGWLRIASTIWLHVVQPWTFIGLSIYLLRSTYKQEYPIWKIVSIALIYPCIYELYLIILPFNTGVSIYSWITNLNPFLYTFVNHAIPNSIRHIGRPTYFVFFILMFLIFSVISFLYS